ncbi:MAG: rhomboid family intramembrane serine protease [Bacteroidales bacterium]|jgi:membrane associated rhomboid family serine protease|nr:rhomboid family intramembrane serine protease [Bacteroidales bacterium]MBR4352484.1 rhomboid family intramembrane serine protease [Bacteroidales bacterium]
MLRNLPPAVKNLLIINIIIFLGTEFIGNPMYEWFALFPVDSPFFHWWQLVTHMFMHGGFGHIFFNMWSLIVFGPVLERMWGSKKFLIYYFVCGLGAAICHEAVLHFFVPGMLNVPTVGASGAIYGLLLGFGMLYPNYTLTLLFPPVSLQAKWFVIIFAAIELLTGILGTSDGVAHFAHLGGMLFGLILILIWKKQGKMYSEWH